MNNSSYHSQFLDLRSIIRLLNNKNHQTSRNLENTYSYNNSSKIVACQQLSPCGIDKLNYLILICYLCTYTCVCWNDNKFFGIVVGHLKYWQALNFTIILIFASVNGLVLVMYCR